MSRSKSNIIFILLTLLCVQPLFAKDQKPEFYSLIIYRIKDKVQEEKIDQYQQADIPATSMGKESRGFQNNNFWHLNDVTNLCSNSFQSLPIHKITLLQCWQKLQLDGAPTLTQNNETPYERMETI